MAAYDGSLKFDTKIDTKSFEKDLGKLKTIATAGAAAISAGFGAAIKIGSDFEEAMSSVAAISLATGEQYEKLSAAAKEMGETTQFSATQAANALEYLSLAGYNAEDSVKALPKVLDLAAAGGMDLAYASDLLTDSMAVMGLGIDDMSNFSDQLAMAASKSNTSVQQLGEAVLIAGGQAKLAGLDVDDMNTALGILADNGIKGSEGGTALRNTLKNLYTPTSQAAKELANLGVVTSDAEGNLRPMQDVLIDLDKSLSNLSESDKVKAMDKIFDTRTIASATALLKNSNKRWNELNGYLKDCDGSAKKMAKTMNDNLKGKIKLLGSAAEGLAISIYDGIKEPLKDAVSFAASKISQLSKAFSSGSLKSALQNIGTLLGNLVSIITNIAAAVLPPLISAIGFLGSSINILLPIIAASVVAIKGWQIMTTITSIINSSTAAVTLYTTALAAKNAGEALSTAQTAALTAGLGIHQLAIGVVTGQISLATAAQWAWNAAMTANPIGAIIVAVAALIAGLAALAICLGQESEEEKERKKHIEETTQALKEQKQALIDNTNASVGSLKNTRDLVGELDNLVDANGKVKEGYEGRAQFILNEMNSAFGTEYELVDGSIQKWGELKSTIQETMDTKMMDAYVEQAKKMLDEVEPQITELQQTTIDAADAYRSKEEELNSFIASMTDEQEAMYKKRAAAKKELAELEKQIADENREATADETTKIQELTQTITDNSMTQLTTLENELAEKKSKWQEEKHLLETALSYRQFYNDIGIAAAEKNLSKVESIYSKMTGATAHYTGENDKEFKENVKNVTANFGLLISEMDKGNGKITLATAQGAKDFKNALMEYQAAYGKLPAGINEGMLEALVLITDTNTVLTDEVKNQINEALGAEYTEGTGYDTVAGIAEGIRNGEEDAVTAMKTICESIVNSSVDYLKIASPSKIMKNDVGPYIPEGLALGILGGRSTVINAAVEIARAGIIAAKNELQIKSPSKKWADEVGVFIPAGIALGITKNKMSAILAITNLNEDMLAAQKLYLKEKARIEEEEELREEQEHKAEYEKSLKEAKDAAEIEKLKQEEIEYQQDRANKKYLEALEERAEREKEIYEDISEYAKEQFEKVADKQQSMADKLSSFGSLTYSPSSDDPYTEQKLYLSEPLALKDQKMEMQVREVYKKQLDALKNRLGAFSKDIRDAFLAEITDLDIIEGSHTAALLNNLSANDFMEYVTDWNKNKEFSREIAAEFYSDDVKEAIDNSYDYAMETFKKLADMGYTFSDDFANSGKVSGENFADAFIKEFSAQIPEIGEKIKDAFGSFSDNIFKEIQANRAKIEMNAVTPAGANITNYYNNSSFNVTGSGQTVNEAYNQYKAYEAEKRLRGI